MVTLMLSSVIFATLFSLVIGTTEYYGLDEGKAVFLLFSFPFLHMLETSCVTVGPVCLCAFALPVFLLVESLYLYLLMF